MIRTLEIPVTLTVLSDDEAGQFALSAIQFPDDMPVDVVDALMEAIQKAKVLPRAA